VQRESRRPGVGWLFFSPSGRAGRQVFILSWLFWMMINAYTVTKLTLHQDDEEMLPLWSALFFAGFLLSVVSSVMLSIKRLHDMGLPGILAVIIFVPAVSLIMLFVLCIWPSARGANEYGPATDRPKTE